MNQMIEVVLLLLFRTEIIIVILSDNKVQLKSIQHFIQAVATGGVSFCGRLELMWERWLRGFKSHERMIKAARTRPHIFDYCPQNHQNTPGGSNTAQTVGGWQCVQALCECEVCVSAQDLTKCYKSGFMSAQVIVWKSY